MYDDRNATQHINHFFPNKQISILTFILCTNQKPLLKRTNSHSKIAISPCDWIYNVWKNKDFTFHLSRISHQMNEFLILTLSCLFLIYITTLRTLLFLRELKVQCLKNTSHTKNLFLNKQISIRTSLLVFGFLRNWEYNVWRIYHTRKICFSTNELPFEHRYLYSDFCETENIMYDEYSTHKNLFLKRTNFHSSTALLESRLRVHHYIPYTNIFARIQSTKSEEYIAVQRSVSQQKNLTLTSSCSNLFFVCITIFAYWSTNVETLQHSSTISFPNEQIFTLTSTCSIIFPCDWTYNVWEL